MPAFDIVKKSEIKETFRVAKIMGDYDLQLNHSDEHFKGNFELPENWNIGIIVGNSGTGKTTIAKEIFGDNLFRGFKYKATSVIDDMPKNASIDEIQKIFYAVGFASVPSWLKPYKVLSNGEKMRVDIARCLLQNKITVFDEFTSVVDRQIAKVICIAISKAIKESQRKFIAISCHYDIIEWLQPDWIFNTETMTINFQFPHAQQSNLQLKGVGLKNGKSLGNIII